MVVMVTKPAVVTMKALPRTKMVIRRNDFRIDSSGSEVEFSTVQKPTAGKAGVGEARDDESSGTSP
jgi:hypothetical protein